MPSASSSRLFFGIGLTALVMSFLIIGVGNAQWNILSPSSSTPTTQQPATVVSFPEREQQIIDAVKRTEPSVVSVIVSAELPIVERRIDTVPFGRNGQLQIPRYVENGTELREVGGGTAFFVSADGLLLTNRHVVLDDQAQYTVLLNDGRKLPATVVARDSANDIALLKVDGSGYEPIAIAASDDVQLGQTAIAIGNALGEFRNTVSVGVVSGLRRSITAGGLPSGGVERLDEIIQTDAAISEGNSGGPLLNSRGEVIGMNTAVSSVGQNIGFAIPAAELRRVLESYGTYGRIIRTYIGVRYVTITTDLQKEQNLPYGEGLLILRGEDGAPAVLPGSPAEKAGLKENDIILEADGTRLTPDRSLQSIIRNKKPGDTVRLKVATAGKERELTLTVAELSEDAASSAGVR